MTQFGDQIEPLAGNVQPGGAFPTGPHQHLAPRGEHRGDASRLQVGPVGDADLALLDRYPVEPLATVLVGDFEEPEAFRGQLKTAVDAVASIRRIRRKRLAAGAPLESAWPTSTPSQSPLPRSRCSRPTLEMSTSPMALAQAVVERSPPGPRQ
jgi:hypothetical protein